MYFWGTLLRYLAVLEAVLNGTSKAVLWMVVSLPLSLLDRYCSYVCVTVLTNVTLFHASHSSLH